MSTTARNRPIVVDGDKTLWQGISAEAIGKAYLLAEARRGHVRTVASALKGASRIKAAAEKVGVSEAQKMFYEILVSTGVGTWNGMYHHAKRYIDSHLVGGVREMVEENVNNGIPVFLSTVSGTTAARYAINSLGLTSGIFNEEVFDRSGRLAGIDLTITSGESKLLATEVMLALHDIKISECTVIGDSALDIPMMKASARPLASPHASQEVLSIPGIVQLRG